MDGGAPIPCRPDLGASYSIYDEPALKEWAKTDPHAAVVAQNLLYHRILSHGQGGHASCNGDETDLITRDESNSHFYDPTAHARAEQLDQDFEDLMQLLPNLLGDAGRAMDPLSPRSSNIKISQKPATKQEVAEIANAKLAAAKKAQKEKDHAAPPPSIIYQPEGPSGEPAEKYKTGRLLGKGGFAICHEGELRGKRYGQHVYKFALKIVKAEMSQKKMQEKVR